MVLSEDTDHSVRAGRHGAQCAEVTAMSTPNPLIRHSVCLVGCGGVDFARSGVAEAETDRVAARGEMGMGRMMQAYWRDEDGVTTMEYALLLVLICLGSLAAFSNLGSGVNNLWEQSVKAVLGR